VKAVLFINTPKKKPKIDFGLGQKKGGRREKISSFVRHFNGRLFLWLRKSGESTRGNGQLSGI